MMKTNLNTLLKTAIIAVAATAMVACNEKKFHVNGTITNANDSTLYLEDMTLNGPEAVDSVKLDESGAFSFSGKAGNAPEFYRLRIAGQIINIAADSTETIDIKADYPTMSAQYEVSGNDECPKIRELALLQQQLQSQVNSIFNSPNLGIAAAEDSVQKVLTAYKDKVKNEYIFKAPMKAYSYFALFQTVNIGNMSALIFNPRNSEDDVKVFAAVATSWDTYFPHEERGQNLHNIAIEGMKNVRIIRSKMVNNIDASKVNYSGVIDIPLNDNKGVTRHLTDLKGKVVLLDFHVFASSSSMKRIMALRELYNKYHDQGFEIYQVSLDSDEHFWKTQTSALPWICVRDENGPDAQAVTVYNVQTIPTYFLITKDNVLYKRDAQMKDLEAEIKSLL